MRENVLFNAELVCSTIRNQIAECPEGEIDPFPVLMNGAMNVLTSLALGVRYNFEESQFIKISEMIKVNLLFKLRYTLICLLIKNTKSHQKRNEKWKKLIFQEKKT